MSYTPQEMVIIITTYQTVFGNFKIKSAGLAFKLVYSGLFPAVFLN